MLVEEAILGTLLKEPHLLADSELKEEYFQVRENRNILKALKGLSAKGKAIDMITLLTTGSPEELGGAGKLNRIQTLANELKFDSYVEVLMDSWREREKLNILEKAKHENWSLDKIIMELNFLTSNIVNDHQSIRDLVVNVAEDPWIQKEQSRGVLTGLDELQRATNGWQNGELIILAARPSMGKTDVMLHFAKQAGWNDCLPIVFSLEMNSTSLRDRLIASTGPYNRSKMRDLYNRLTDAQKKTWMNTLAKVGETNIEIFDKSGQTIPEIRMKIRKLKNQYPEKQPIVFIDYLTLIKPTDVHKGNMHLATSDISKGLKAIAKEFDCPVISLAQLSRQVEQRTDKRPMLSDLRESGSIEEDADVVIFLYRDSYYSKNEEDKTLEMIIAKQRNGEIGMVSCLYNKYTGVIS
ncbi:replicative DNA helicase [Psychrobacillus psychrotolerans]|uniref:replicative DNA helicase n=1 Tax=Psychrobacillus psychrotolerans TaxID=126156 RepID=UPI003C70EFEF